MSHLRPECELKTICHDADLVPKVLTGLEPILSEYLKQRPNIPLEISEDIQQVKRSRKKQPKPLECDTEQSVNAKWVVDYVNPAIQVLASIIDPNSVGQWELGCDPCDALPGDLPGLNPWPDGIFLFRPQSEDPLTSETSGTSHASTSAPAAIEVNEKSVLGEGPEKPTIGESQMHNDRLQIVTWETKPPFYNPTLLEKFQALINGFKDELIAFTLVRMYQFKNLTPLKQSRSR